MQGRDYVIPDDLFALAEDVILHRIRLNYEALADGKTAAGVLQQILTDFGRRKPHEEETRAFALLWGPTVVSAECCQLDASRKGTRACPFNAEKSALDQSAEKPGILKTGNIRQTPPSFETTPLCWKRSRKAGRRRRSVREAVRHNSPGSPGLLFI